ncbi:DUF6461 domain-containing protein [Acrocarpospora macrocephala]|uniref:DUF6461 domain-containing protein n=1 Tax=Acrocarpospora macrocephala TaxID=150177 RepID=UPI0012D2D8A7|nr:DUF6461 domain-containing protein [Acrocarpospora macrocephala]
MTTEGQGLAAVGDYNWVPQARKFGQGFCASFISGLASSDVIERLELREEPGRQGPDTVQIGTVEGGAIMIEYGGQAGVLLPVIRQLSQGTEIASVTRSDHHRSRFVHARDRYVISSFDPMFPEWHTSREPDDLRRNLEDLGMLVRSSGDDDGFFDQYLEGAFALAERYTGVRLRDYHIHQGLPHRASIAHYYPSDFLSEFAWTPTAPAGSDEY